MSKKTDELLKILSDTSVWVSSSTLAKMLGVSERTIRNYINKIHEEGIYQIEASRYGYRLASAHEAQENGTNDAEYRKNHILSKLLTAKEGISIFDEANELFISESTLINTVIPQIKEMIKGFDLKIESKNYQYYLIGKEQDKRKLIGHLVTNNAYGYFTSTEALENLFPDADIQTVLQGLYDTCQQSNLFLNNYALNNLLVHILIILIRLGTKDSLHSLDFEQNIDQLLAGIHEKEEIIALADHISRFFEEVYGQKIPEKDYRQILILILLSVNHECAHLENIIEEDFIQVVAKLMNELAERYGIAKFGEEFTLQFALHMYNARQRSSFKISYPNPIAEQIKKDYAPVYDMAVFFAHRFAKHYQLELSEDEIAFIAFHIGAYLENDKKNNTKSSCIVIVENYHNVAKRLIADIQDTFQNEINLLDMMSYNRFLMAKPKCDLLITTVPLTVKRAHCVLVNPILTKQNIREIWLELSEIEDENKKDEAREFLKSLFHRSLYFRNVDLDSKQAYIEFMGEQCTQQGYIQHDFINDVLLRESVSSTAFTDSLAIPHAISQYADKSFICVVHNDTAIKWESKQVHFILMIGITEHDMKYFRNAFDLIIDLFYSTDRTVELLNTRNFDEFMAKMR